MTATLGTVRGYSLADEVGTVELDGGETVRFGRLALGDVVPVVGARVEALELAAHPLGGRRAIRLASFGAPAPIAGLRHALASAHADHTDESERQLLRMRRSVPADTNDVARAERRAAAASARAAIASLAELARHRLERSDERGAWIATLRAAGLDATTSERIVTLARPALRLEPATDLAATSWLAGSLPRRDDGLVPIGQFDLGPRDAAALDLPAVTLACRVDPGAQPWSPSEGIRCALVALDERIRTAAEAHGRPLALRAALTLPHPSALELEAVGLTAVELAGYERATLAVHAALARPYAVGQIGGLAEPIEGAMEPVCERIRRTTREPDGATDARWRLVVQLECAREGPLPMWADRGCLYFWMRDDDLSARRWGDAACILQSH